MRGWLVDRRWESAPDIYAPARFRRACGYQFVEPRAAPTRSALTTIPRRRPEEW
jgi:hypothetical protein